LHRAAGHISATLLNSTIVSIKLRPELPDDQAFLYRLYASTRAREMELVDWSFEQKASFLGMQFYAQHKHYVQRFPNARFEIIEEHGTAVGRRYVNCSNSEIRIVDIALLPEHCGKGIGSRLIAQVLDQGAREGLPVTIHVEQFNPALRLYQRLGFKPLHLQGVYWLMQWHPQAGEQPAHDGPSPHKLTHAETVLAQPLQISGDRT
jgi:GNAT superfamily N-acetyltransferase